MKSIPEHACDECLELVEALQVMKAKLHKAKRVGSLEAMQIELCALETEMGGLRMKALEMKAFVTWAVGGGLHRRDEGKGRGNLNFRN
jgi:hypothetical protein